MSGEEGETGDTPVISLIVVTLITQLCTIALSAFKLYLHHKERKHVHLSSSGSLDLEDGVPNAEIQVSPAT